MSSRVSEQAEMLQSMRGSRLDAVWLWHLSCRVHLAGLAGVTYYLGYFGSIQPKVLASTGFDSIAVSLLANSNPIGIIFSSFLITVISKGSTYMNSASGLESEIASVITGVILLFSACGAFIRYKVKSMKEELKESEERGNR